MTKDYDAIIDRLEAMRGRNNGHWMGLFRLAFRVAPDEAKELARKIYDTDREILDVARELYE